MCGITGITDTQIEKLEEAIQKMTKVIAHRGPDDDGFFVGPKVALGMRRLAIIDLERGRQPMSSSDGRYLIFFNGEIYNYKELKRELEKAGESFATESDTEVLLRLFEREGAECFKRLRGMFAVAIYDTKAERLVLARDPFGIKPLYYWKRGNKIAAFSSEIKSFLSLKGFQREVNDAAVWNYLSYQYNPLEETFFKGVFKLPPGHFMTIDLATGVFETKRFYAFEFKPDEAQDEGETKEDILRAMKDSVRHHMIADVPVGSFLSGGIDSSIIATLMQEIRGDKSVKTFTVGFGSVSEGLQAKETAAPLGTDHAEVSVGPDEYFDALQKAVYHFDEPVADPSAIGLYFLAREARKSVKVVLSGEGADELFGGYNVYLAPIAAAKLRNIVPRFLLKIATYLPVRGREYASRAASKLEEWYIGNARVFMPNEARKVWKGKPQESVRLSSLYAEAKGLSDSTTMQYIDINTWLVGDILAKADKMTMAHSLELRVPFLDVEVAKLAAALPDRFKWRDGVTKYLLREAFASVLPESTRTRKKLGFPTPLREWLDTSRGELYGLIVGNDYIAGHFDTKEIKRIIGEHVSRRRDNSRKIYLLLMLAIWYNTFIRQ
ncbi:asparagine synthase (glutamine-hydrolyzing) [Candidatus Parcubacteria bacterium]|nr:asparagine synthase (glutamine-hydrolyzing) [Candidatus Parcubacteria bacterium]